MKYVNDSDLSLDSSGAGVERYSEVLEESSITAKAPAFDATVAIVIAYLKTTTCSCEQVSELLRDIHKVALEAIYREKIILKEQGWHRQDTSNNIVPTLSISIEDSVTDEYLICLEDGEKVKGLKRYLRTRYGMTTEQYRLKWGLPDNYPFVAPALSKKRSLVAKRVKPHIAKYNK